MLANLSNHCRLSACAYKTTTVSLLAKPAGPDVAISGVKQRCWSRPISFAAAHRTQIAAMFNSGFVLCLLATTAVYTAAAQQDSSKKDSRAAPAPQIERGMHGGGGHRGGGHGGGHHAGGGGHSHYGGGSHYSGGGHSHSGSYSGGGHSHGSSYNGYGGRSGGGHSHGSSYNGYGGRSRGSRSYHTGGYSRPANNYYYAPAPMYVPAPSYPTTYYDVATTTDNSCTCNGEYFADCSQSQCASMTVDDTSTTYTTTDTTYTTTDTAADAGSTWTFTIGRKLRQQGVRQH